MSKPSRDLLSRLSSRLRGLSAEESPIYAEFSGIRFRLRRNLHPGVQDWVWAATQDSGEGRVMGQLRKAAAHILSISYDGEPDVAVEELFPATAQERRDIPDFARQTLLAGRIVTWLMDSDSTFDRASDIVTAILDALRLEQQLELSQKMEEERRKLAPAPVPLDSGEAGKASPQKTEEERTAETIDESFGAYGPLSELPRSGR